MRSSSRPAAGLPLSTCKTSPSASSSVNPTGASVVPRPSRYPPDGPRAPSIVIPASRSVATYRRAARSVTPSRSARFSAEIPGCSRRMSSALIARAVGLGVSSIAAG